MLHYQLSRTYDAVEAVAKGMSPTDYSNKVGSYKLVIVAEVTEIWLVAFLLYRGKTY